MDKEEWVSVAGTTEYKVSTFGNVFSVKADKVLAQYDGGDGYSCVALHIGGKTKVHRVHSLVLTAFAGPRPSRKHVCCHGNGCRSDNRLCNLRWGTYAENEADKLMHGTRSRGETHGIAKLTDTAVVEIRALNATKALSQQELADIYGTTQANIQLITSRKAWAHVPMSLQLDAAMKGGRT